MLASMLHSGMVREHIHVAHSVVVVGEWPPAHTPAITLHHCPICPTLKYTWDHDSIRNHHLSARADPFPLWSAPAWTSLGGT